MTRVGLVRDCDDGLADLREPIGTIFLHNLGCWEGSPSMTIDLKSDGQK
jgi:hypothetical protein